MSRTVIGNEEDGEEIEGALSARVKSMNFTVGTWEISGELL